MTSPDLAEQLAPDALAARLAVGHHAAARAEDRDPHAGAHALDAVVPDVHAAPRRRDATHAVDRRLAVAPVAEHERQRLGLDAALARAHVVDVALGLEDPCDVLLEARVRHLDAVVPRHRGVADAGEHVRDGIGHHGITSSP